MSVKPKDVAKYLAIVRLGIGSTLLLAPGFAGRLWIGPHGDGPGARTFARAIGIRDVLLGSRALSAQSEGLPLRRWMRYEAAVDAADAVATVAAAKHLTPGRRVAMPLIAASYAALGLWAANGLD